MKAANVDKPHGFGFEFAGTALGGQGTTGMHSPFHRHVLSLAAVAVCSACHNAWSEEPVSRSRDEAAIRQRAKGYLQAIERGAGEKVASFWTENGDYVDDSGRAINGRQLSRQAATRRRQEADARGLSAGTDSIRFVTPDVALEDGALRVKHGSAEEAVVKRYTAVWVRRGGTWLLDAVRELASPPPSRQNPLDDLTWMRGEWISEGGDKSIRVSCKQSDDKHFLLLEMDVSGSEEQSLHVSQRIGWDAREKQIKSWAFDSSGGHGDGLWFRKDDGWIVEATRVLPDGSRTTSTNKYSLDGPDVFVWQVTNWEIDGEPKPDLSVRMVRRKASDAQ